MAKILDENDYYDYGRVLSRNCAWNFIIGARGLGKTYGAKKLVINDWMKRRWQFIYLRRTDEEQKNKGTFFADIQHEYADTLEFRVSGNQAECRFVDDHDAIVDKKTGKKKPVWHIMGYFIALSQAGHVKSVAYPKVRTIIYDEIFPNNLRYLSGEVTALEEFYNTVDRWNDRVRLIMCSNAVSMANPYFAKFKINVQPQMDDGAQYRKYCGGFIMVELADYGGFSAKVAQSRFGTFLMQYDEDYAEYSMNNAFMDNTQSLIADMDGAQYAFTIKTSEYGDFSIYQTIDENGTSLIISRKRPKIVRCYTFDYRNVSESCIMLSRSDDLTQKLLMAYRTGRLRFDDPQIKSEFSMILGSLLQQSGVRR